MTNLDYPGPCFSCMGVDGCASEAQRQEAAAHYCKGLEMELNTWKARLYDVLVSDKNDDLMDEINLIKSIVRELDAVIAQMQDSCPVSLGDKEKLIGAKLKDLRVHYTKALEVISPGWFGG